LVVGALVVGALVGGRLGVHSLKDEERKKTRKNKK
jgi:hypothetical protein